MSEFKMPAIVSKINKDKKVTKITTLKEAKALRLQRMFSGSVILDSITKGGYAYRRIHVSFGVRSSGKNALLNQCIAYNQRLCRYCHGIRPDFYNRNPQDRWTIFLENVLKINRCVCDNFEGKKFLILDYEKSISTEKPRIITIRDLTDKKTGEKIDEIRYNENIEYLNEAKLKESLDEEEKANVREIEKWLKNIDIVENQIEQLPAEDYMLACGVLIDELLVSDPSDTEEGIEMSRDFIASKEVDGIIWDSIQAAIPKWVKSRDADADTMGKEAKQNALLMRHICSAFSANDLTDVEESYKPAYFITSQMRSYFGGGVSYDTYSGGNALKHHTAIALECKRDVFLGKNGEEVKDIKKVYYGQRIRIRAEKNKLGPPGDIHEVDYYFREGGPYGTGTIDHSREIVSLGIDLGIIQQASAHYKIGNDNFHGMEKLMEYFKQNPEYVGVVYDQIKEKLF